MCDLARVTKLVVGIRTQRTRRHFFFTSGGKKSPTTKCSVDDIINYKIELQDASSFGDIKIDRLSSQISIISGPSQQTSMQWINGSVTNSKTISWTLAPKITGKIKIPSLDVRIGGQIYKTNQITLQVVGSKKKTI